MCKKNNLMNNKISICDSCSYTDCMFQNDVCRTECYFYRPTMPPLVDWRKWEGLNPLMWHSADYYRRQNALLIKTNKRKKKYRKKLR